MKKFIQDLWTLAVERAKTKKALRILNKQEWSIEFLQAMLIRAAKGGPLQMTIHGPNGYSYTVDTLQPEQATYADESIFDHLDNEVKIRQFMEQLNK